MFLRKISLILAFLALACSVFAQESNRGTAEITINGKKISINYGRPSLHGRDLLSQAPVGTVWRLGMNEPTTIETAADLTVGGKAVTAGKYSLWMKRISDESWIVAFHPTVPRWGKPELTTGYIAELPVQIVKAGEPADLLTVSLANKQSDVQLTIHWGSSEFVGSFSMK